MNLADRLALSWAVTATAPETFSVHRTRHDVDGRSTVAGRPGVLTLGVET